MRGPLCLFLSCFVLVVAASADVVYDNGSPGGTGYYIGTNAEYRSDFSLSSSTHLTQLNFWTTCSAAGATQWAFYSDAGGAPGALITGGSSATSCSLYAANPGCNTYQKSLGLNLDLGPGTFWLGICGIPTYFTISNSWNGTSTYLYVNGAIYDPYPNGVSADYAFNLEGNSNVPEPASLVLLGSGLVVAANRLRHIKR